MPGSVLGPHIHQNLHVTTPANPRYSLRRRACKKTVKTIPLQAHGVAGDDLLRLSLGNLHPPFALGDLST